MRIIPNSGSDRVIDLARASLAAGSSVDLMSPAFSLLAFNELIAELQGLDGARLVLPSDHSTLSLLGGPADRAARNRLQTRWLAREAADWLEKSAELRHAVAGVPQAALVVHGSAGAPRDGVLGSFAFTTDGFGMNRPGFVGGS